MFLPEIFEKTVKAINSANNKMKEENGNMKLLNLMPQKIKIK